MVKTLIVQKETKSNLPNNYIIKNKVLGNIFIDLLPNTIYDLRILLGKDSV